MVLELVSENDIKSGRGGGGKKGAGQKYPKYRSAVATMLPWFKEQVDKHGTIRVKTSDVAREMGREFESKHPTSITWALKFVLFNEGLFVTTGKTNDDKPILVIRSATHEDKLPDSLEKFNRPKEELGELGELGNLESEDSKIEKELREDEKEEDE